MKQDPNENNLNNAGRSTKAPETNVDFSKYMGGDQEDVAPTPKTALEPEKNVPATHSPKFIAMVAILVILAGVFTWLILRDRKPPFQVPEGYRMVTPKGDTPRLQKIPN